MCLSWFRGELNPHNVSDIMSHVTDREAADATTRRGGGDWPISSDIIMLEIMIMIIV